MKGTYLYVGHSKGEFEGSKYDNVKLSDGVRVISVKNKTGQTDFEDRGFIPEKSKVECIFVLTSNKEVANVALVGISLLK